MSFSFAFENNNWTLTDAHTGARATFDQAIVDVTYRRPEKMIGLIVAIHGLEQAAVDRLGACALRDIGVGANLRRSGFPPRGVSRVRLMEGGQIERIL